MNRNYKELDLYLNDISTPRLKQMISDSKKRVEYKEEEIEQKLNGLRLLKEKVRYMEEYLMRRDESC